MTFLRPWWLLLIVIPFIFNRVLKKQHAKNMWKNIIDPKLLPHLLVSNNTNVFARTWSVLLSLLWILFSVAMAGPAIEKAPIPASADLENTVVVLDLGPTMTPQTLNIAHAKLYDLLDLLTSSRIGLVLYADKGYTAVPLTADKAMVKNLIPTLNPSVLPNTRNNPKVGFAQADQLIQQAGGSGRILYITAGGVNVQGIKSKHPIAVLAVGNTENVSPALKGLGAFHARTIDNTDLISLINATPLIQANTFETTDMADYAFDLGGILCLILLPFLAWTFRKGMLFVLVLVFSIQSQAAFFKRKDQMLYESEQQAVAAYNAQDYGQALSHFAHSPYNQGNTLAYMGKIPEAIQSYQLALQLNPNDQDAKFNKEYLEEQLKKQQQEEQQKSDQNQQENSDQEQSEQQSSEQESQAENESSDQQQEETDDQQQTQSEQEETEQQAQQQQQENDAVAPQETQEDAQQNQPTPLDTAEQQMPFNQQDQQILNRLNKDPSQVLRYRIYKQHIQGE